MPCGSMSQPRWPIDDERGADRGVAVRVKLHRRADDIGDLVEAAVVHVPEGVEDAALHRLQAVVDVRHGAVEDDVAGVVEEPVAVADGERRLLVLDLLAGLARWERGASARGGARGWQARGRGLGVASAAGVERELGLIASFGRFVLASRQAFVDCASRFRLRPGLSRRAGCR